MTTTDLEPAAWMYGAEREEPFASFKRWPAGVVAMQCWTETALYTADQLQALIEERDRLRNGLIRAESDLHLIALYPRLTYDNLREVYIARDNARAALAGEQ